MSRLLTSLLISVSLCTLVVVFWYRHAARTEEEYQVYSSCINSDFSKTSNQASDHTLYVSDSTVDCRDEIHQLKALIEHNPYVLKYSLNNDSTLLTFIQSVKVEPFRKKRLHLSKLKTNVRCLFRSKLVHSPTDNLTYIHPITGSSSYMTVSLSNIYFSEDYTNAVVEVSEDSGSSLYFLKKADGEWKLTLRYLLYIS